MLTYRQMLSLIVASVDPDIEFEDPDEEIQELLDLGFLENVDGLGSVTKAGQAALIEFDYHTVCVPRAALARVIDFFERFGADEPEDREIVAELRLFMKTSCPPT